MTSAGMDVPEREEEKKEQEKEEEEVEEAEWRYVSMYHSCVHIPLDLQVLFPPFCQKTILGDAVHMLTHPKLIPTTDQSTVQISPKTNCGGPMNFIGVGDIYSNMGEKLFTGAERTQSSIIRTLPV